MALTLATAPTSEPLTIDEAKTHCLVGSDITDQDAYLDTILIPAVRERAELATQRALLPQTWDLVLDAFPGEGYLELPRPPLTSVTHVKYRDTAGVLQTWAASNYVVEAPVGPRCRRGRISLAYGVTWPSTYGQAGDVTVRFVCGYTNPASVPPLLKTAMLLDCASLYANREGEAPMSETVAKIYRSFKSWSRQQGVA